MNIKFVELLSGDLLSEKAVAMNRIVPLILRVLLDFSHPLAVKWPWLPTFITLQESDGVLHSPTNDKRLESTIRILLTLVWAAIELLPSLQNFSTAVARWYLRPCENSSHMSPVSLSAIFSDPSSSSLSSLESSSMSKSSSSRSSVMCPFETRKKFAVKKSCAPVHDPHW